MNHQTLTEEQQQQIAKAPKWAYNPYAESHTAYLRNNDVTKPAEDYFYWLSQMNKASIIINSEEGLLDKKYAVPFAQGLHTVIKNGNTGGPRPQNIVEFEPYLIAEAGPEASRIHAGRSSQDMLTTASMAIMRQALLDLSAAVISIAETLNELAEKNKETIIPAYTNGVAAQPTSYGHYLHAFIEGFCRDQDRIQEYYQRVNRCALGSMVLNGTGWPLNRDRLASCLGFDEVFENCYDATQIYTLEYAAETAAVCSVIALHVSNFIADIMQQYAQTRPWILLQEDGTSTYVSSAMPQKRNPGILNSTRTKASSILGDCTGAVIRAHNIPSGMADARGVDLTLLVWETTNLLQEFHHILTAIHINPQRSLEELNLDWTASQEVADLLMRKYNIPFRIGHHVASNIVDFARKNNLYPTNFPYKEACRIYKNYTATIDIIDIPKVFPMDEYEFKTTLDPTAIVQHRAVKGGPQLPELKRMLTESIRKIKDYKLWHDQKSTAIAIAKKNLEAAFQKLLKQS